MAQQVAEPGTKGETGATPAEILEQSLWAVAESGEDITPHFFKRLFESYPDQEKSFYHPADTCGTMVNEMIEMLMALAAEETWVDNSTRSLVMAHRCFGDIKLPLYAESLQLLIDTLADLASDNWTPEFDKAWRGQAERLSAIIKDAY